MRSAMKSAAAVAALAADPHDRLCNRLQLYAPGDGNHKPRNAAPGSRPRRVNERPNASQQAAFEMFAKGCTVQQVMTALDRAERHKRK